MASTCEARENPGLIWRFPCWLSSPRKISSEHPFFVDGNVQRELIASHIAEELTAEETEAILSENQWDLHLDCPIAGCKAKLSNVREFDAHHASRHMATCAACSKIFPTSRLLNFHVAENHDSFFKAKAARNYAMYECLVEGCTNKFQSDSIRKQHLVKIHHFPTSFQFSKGHHHLSQKSRIKQQQRRKGGSSAESNKPATKPGQVSPENMDVDSLTAGLSRLNTGPTNMPNSIAFGRRRGRGILGTKGHSSTKQGQDQVVDADPSVEGDDSHMAVVLEEK